MTNTPSSEAKHDEVYYMATNSRQFGRLTKTITEMVARVRPNSNIKVTCPDVEALEAKLTKAIEALKFYADEGNWYHPDVYSSKYRCIDVSDMEYDDELDHHNYKEVGGKTARKALESIGE
jgi:hypothetical protein